MKYIKSPLFTLFIGGLIVWFLYPYLHQTDNTQQEHTHTASQIWTCSMHPQIRQHEEGDCPLCGMDLIPLETDKTDDDISSIRLSEQAVRLAQIQTSIIQKGNTNKNLRLNGKVQIDERRKFNQTAHFSGRIEKLYINFTGEKVHKGQKLASIYSPELVVAQKELLEALALKESQPYLWKASREKLKRWKLSDKQIKQIEQSGKAITSFPIYADQSGIITKLEVADGNHVMEGAVFMEITDLKKLWVVFDAYEQDLAWLHLNDEIAFHISAYPSDILKAKITYIDPVVNATSRIAKVRVEINNVNQKLKPEMFAEGLVYASSQTSENELTVPKSAILWTGERSVAYVQKKNTNVPTFEMREVSLGASLGNTYIIKSGLQEGDAVVTNGTFTVDATAQLNNKNSMMNRLATSEENETTQERIFEVSKVFKKQLSAFTASYLQFKDALITSDAKLSQSKIAPMLESFTKIDMGLLKGEAHHAWMKNAKGIQKELNALKNESDLKAQRKVFTSLSDILISVNKSFGSNQKLYHQFCPMANNDTGGHWLSSEEEILNPYFGDEMLGCGAIEGIIE